MSFSDRFIQVARTLLPMPFTIAIGLTFLTFLLAFLLTGHTIDYAPGYVIDLMEYWEGGLWNTKLLVFAFQMMLMLVLGHTLALTRPVTGLINSLLKYCTNTANAAAIVTFLTLCVSFFNWGLGLIFGAIFARKVGEYARHHALNINYGLIGACGYAGLMVWHGGLSGSSLVKIAEKDHLKDMMAPIYGPEQLAALPEFISFAETVFSPMNIVVSLVLLAVLPLSMYAIGRKSRPTEIHLSDPEPDPAEQERIGAEKLDHSSILAYITVALILFMAVYKAFIKPETFSLAFINPNYINLLLLGLGIALHGSFFRFLKAVDHAIAGAAGILIQFPLYFGIMGIMTSSGLVNVLSEFFVHISNEFTYPVFTFISAGLVNVFVPSGGGQWAVQGPVIIQASQNLGVDLPKCIMAMAYGDQLTNMLQPFWALPLLGITGLKAKDILPYTLFLMLLGIVIFSLGLMIF